MSEEIKCNICKEAKNHWLFVWRYHDVACALLTTATKDGTFAVCLDCWKATEGEGKKALAVIIRDSIANATEWLIRKESER